MNIYNDQTPDTSAQTTNAPINKPNQKNEALAQPTHPKEVEEHATPQSTPTNTVTEVQNGRLMQLKAMGQMLNNSPKTKQLTQMRDTLNANTTQPIGHEGHANETTAQAYTQGRGINDQTSLEKEAGQAGQQALETRGQNHAPPSNAAATPSTTIQCYGAIRFANLKDSEPKYQEKGNDIIDTLQNTPSIQNFLNNKNTLITLAYEPGLASVRVIGDQVQITLSPWFFEQQSRGRILGMLAHEFGVHPLGYEGMSVNERNDEQQDINNDTAFATGLPGHSITPGAAGQTDHVFAAIDGQPRFNIYRQTAYEMASDMLQNSQQPAATITEGHVTDLIMTYLSDIAMILATNDHRAQIVAEPQRTADAFAHVRTGWLNFLNGKPDQGDLSRLTPGNKTKGDVLNEVASLAGGFFLSIGTNSTDNTKTKQTDTGSFFSPAYSDLTSAQRDVLGDYALNLQPKNLGGALPTLMNALDDALGFNDGDSIQMIHNFIQNQLPHNDQKTDTDLRKLDQDLANNRLGNPLTNDNLHYISFMLQHEIRLMDPSGNFRQRGNGNSLTILEVKQPRWHYRFAT